MRLKWELAVRLERLFGEKRRRTKVIPHAQRTAPVVNANVTASPTRLSSKNRT
jgi:hypothetical protein